MRKEGFMPAAGFRTNQRMRTKGSSLPLLLLLSTLFAGLDCQTASAQSGPLVLERNGRVISLEAYAPNIVRVTISTDRAAATGAPGYGFLAKASAEGWTHERDAEGYDLFRSA